MSEDAHGKTPRRPDGGSHSEDPSGERTPKENAAPGSLRPAPPVPDCPPGSAEGKQPGERSEEAGGNLQVEHWQAPKPDKMKADTREIWEFESETVPPSRAFWYSLFLIIFTLAGGLALIACGIWWLVTAAGSSGPELP